MEKAKLSTAQGRRQRSYPWLVTQEQNVGRCTDILMAHYCQDERLGRWRKQWAKVRDSYTPFMVRALQASVAEASKDLSFYFSQWVGWVQTFSPGGEIPPLFAPLQSYFEDWLPEYVADLGLAALKGGIDAPWSTGALFKVDLMLACGRLTFRTDLSAPSLQDRVGRLFPRTVNVKATTATGATITAEVPEWDLLLRSPEERRAVYGGAAGGLVAELARLGYRPLRPAQEVHLRWLFERMAFRRGIVAIAESNWPQVSEEAVQKATGFYARLLGIRLRPAPHADSVARR